MSLGFVKKFKKNSFQRYSLNSRLSTQKNSKNRFSYSHSCFASLSFLKSLLLENKLSEVFIPKINLERMMNSHSLISEIIGIFAKICHL